MKKISILAIALAMPAMAGTVAPIAPAPAPAPAACPCSIEIGTMFRFASRDFTDSPGKAIDTYGVDLTAVHALSENHALTLRVGYAYGSEVLHTPLLNPRFQLDMGSLMPGYRFTQAIDDNLSWFAGANVGFVWGRSTVSVGQFRVGDSDTGVGASAELGLKYKVSDKASLFAAYEFSANNMKYWGKASHQQTYHGVRAGVSFSF